MGNWHVPKRSVTLAAMLLALGTRSAAAGPSPGSDGPDTFWLDVTNITLGLAVLAACLWVAWGIVLEVNGRWRSRRAGAAERVIGVPLPVGAGAGSPDRS
jgi:hypothetical protein